MTCDYKLIQFNTKIFSTPIHHRQLFDMRVHVAAVIFPAETLLLQAFSVHKIGRFYVLYYVIVYRLINVYQQLYKL
jgi:hypothetical protein